MASPQQESDSDLTITPCDDKSLDEIRSQQLKEKATEYGELPKPEGDIETASSDQSNSSLVSWSSAEDKQNPKNFTIFQKVRIDCFNMPDRC